MEPLSPLPKPELWDFEVAETPEQQQVLREAIAYLSVPENIQRDQDYAKKLHGKLISTAVSSEGSTGKEIIVARAIIFEIYEDAMKPSNLDLASLKRLPDEVVLQIIMDLPLKQIGRLRQTDRRLNAIGGEALALKISQENIPLSELELTSPKQIKDFLNSLGNESCKKIQNLNFNSTAIDDEFLKELPQLTPNLKSLTLERCEAFTDDGLQHLAPLTQLRSLNLFLCYQITDAGLQHLALFKELRSLSLFRCDRITDNGLKHIARLTQLESLTLARCEAFTDDGLQHLAPLTRLRSLDLFDCRQITNNGLQHLAPFTRLQSLDLSNCSQITDAGLEHLAPLKELRSLELIACYNITENGCNELRKLLPEVNIIGR